MSLKGKVLFITGSSRGIGKAIALKAAQDGAKIAVIGKTDTPNPKLPGTVFSAVKDIQDAGGEAIPLICDIRFEDQVTQAVKETVEKFGGIDILINNASAISLTQTPDTPMKRFDLMMGINVRGTFLCSQQCLPYLEKAVNPHILTLSPPINLDPRWFQNNTAYTISKYGMSMCVLGMAEEFRRYGIAVNSLWPRTVIGTSAVENLLGGDLTIKHARKPEIVADAAYLILNEPAKTCTGNFFIDDEVLMKHGICNLDKYSMEPGSELYRDFFLGGDLEGICKGKNEMSKKGANKTENQTIFDRARILLKENQIDQWIVASNEGCDVHSKFLLNVASHARSYVIINQNPPDFVIATKMESPMMQTSLKQQGIDVLFLEFDNIIQIPEMLKSTLTGKRIGANFGENLFDQHGTEFADYIRAGDLFSLKTLIPNAEFISAAQIIYGLRAKKSPTEQKDLANVVKATEEILLRLPDWVTIGMSEREVKAKLEFEYNKIGTPSFDTIVGMGPNGANPHHNTDKSTSKITKGPLLIDTGLRIDRMCSDLTWTYWVGGTPDSEFLRAYDVLMQAKRASFTAIKAGAAINQPDVCCREILAMNEYDHVKLYNHGLGHSLGYEVHDIGPRMNWKMDPSIKLEADMVYSNEPGLYWQDEWGIRLEDDLVVTNDGYRLFSKLPKDPITI